MYYLKTFYLFLFKWPIKGAIFLALSIVIISCSFFVDELYFKYARYVNNEVVGPYFYILINNEDSLRDFKKKYSNLPGVQKILSWNVDKVDSIVSEIVKEIHLEEDGHNFLGKMMAIKVILSHDLSTKSQDLLREYAQKLLGEDGIISISQVEYPWKGEYGEILTWPKRMIFSLGHWMISLISMITLVSWFISYLFLRKNFKKFCYILENFQRRKQVRYKIIYMGLLPFLIIPLSCALFIEEVHLSGVFFEIGFFSFIFLVLYLENFLDSEHIF